MRSLSLSFALLISIQMWDMTEPVLPLFSRNLAHSSAMHNLSWDCSGNGGLYFTDQESAGVYCEQVQPVDLRVRQLLYTHGLARGTVHGSVVGLCDQQPLIATVGGDGSMRVGFPSLLAVLRPPGDGLIECFQTLSIDNNINYNRNNNNINNSLAAGTKCMHVGRRVRLVEGASSSSSGCSADSGGGIPSDLSTYLRSIDVVALRDTEAQRDVHCFAYGGAMGVIRIHALDILDTLLAKPVPD
jgi:hypothetical protein